jgi:hypothetical protein
MTAEPITGPAGFHQVAQLLLDGITAHLTPTPGRVCVVPGAIAWDSCDCDGMAAATIARQFLTSSFPAEASALIGSPCDAADLAADIIVQIVRCAPGPDDDGNPPTCAQLDTAAVQVAGDLWTSRLAAYCTLRELRRARQLEAFRLTGQTVLGPEGGCVASQLGVTVALVGGCGCQDL